MTDWAVQSVIFMSKTTRKLPKMRRECPNTALTLYKALFAQIERTAQNARFSQCSMHPRDGGN